MDHLGRVRSGQEAGGHGEVDEGPSWKLIGAGVTVTVGGGQIRIDHAGIEVACHEQRLGRRARTIDRAHLHGIVPRRPDPARNTEIEAASPTMLPGTELLRPLAEYEQVAGGGW